MWQILRKFFWNLNEAYRVVGCVTRPYAAGTRCASGSTVTAGHWASCSHHWPPLRRGSYGRRPVTSRPATPQAQILGQNPLTLFAGWFQSDLFNQPTVFFSHKKSALASPNQHQHQPANTPVICTCYWHVEWILSGGFLLFVSCPYYTWHANKCFISLTFVCDLLNLGFCEFPLVYLSWLTCMLYFGVLDYSQGIQCFYVYI